MVKDPNLEKFYRELYEEHGESPFALSYISSASQSLRFENIARILPQDKEQSFSLLDVGCGFCDLKVFLEKNGYQNIKYAGIDIMPEFIDTARKKYPKISLVVENFLEYQYQKRFDYVVSSGSLNIIVESYQDQYEYVFKMIEKMYALADKGIAFNMLSKDGEHMFPEDRRFYYFDPVKVSEKCYNMCAGADLLHDYLFYDFTILMPKK